LVRLLQAGQRQAASRYASRLGAIFPDDCYLGLELHQHADTQLARECIRLGARFGMEPAVAQPIYTLQPQEAPLLPLLAAIDQNCRVDQVAGRLPAGHWLTPAEIGERFAEFPEAIANVTRIIQQCRPALPNGRSTIWPLLDLPEEGSAGELLREQAKRGLRKSISLAQPQGQDVSRQGDDPYEARLERELEAIIGHGFDPLFLLVADIVRFARERNIPVSTRGSVANSLVAFALGITTIDPVAHDLLFERFLNPSRANLPDIDLDFCSRRRDEVLAYVRAKYGDDRVALVGSMSTMQPKSALREVAKAYGIGEGRIKQLSALLPRGWHPDPRRREKLDVTSVQAQLTDETEREAVGYAFSLVGQPHHLSLHPGGIIITPGPLTDFVPVQWATKGFLSTQLDFQDVEAIGLPKIDLLGIRALTVLADASDFIRAHHDPNFRLEAIPMDDRETGELLSRGETIGVFQCESSGAQRTLRQLQARTVRDLAAANAFFKPGPATGGMAQAFVRRYRGEEAVAFLHPSLEPILAPTKGVLLFQEQVLRIAVEIAGLSWEQADHLRRGMSKFRAREMATMRLSFVTGCQRPHPAGPGLNPSQADTLWEQVMAFAGYGFNQGHATAYAEVSYRSAYLRAHYPAPFLWARLMDRGGFHHPAIYQAEARRLGIMIRPPHVNVSGRKVTLTYGQPPGEATAESNESNPVFWLGLGQVRDLRRKSIKAITQERPFSSLSDLLQRVPMQAKEVIHLIQCGALDGLGTSRAQMLLSAEELLRAGNARQMAFDFMAPATAPPETAAQRLAWEMHLLGLPVSVDPLQLSDLPGGVAIRQLPQLRDQQVSVTGLRLPGWTGGRGWFLSDGDSYVIAQGGQRPPVWQPVRLHGRYKVDAWGGGTFQIE